MNVSKRSERSRNAWLLLAVVALPGWACKSAGATGPGQGSVECVSALLPPQQSLTYTLSCDGFSPELQRIQSGAEVTFVSACDERVFISFSNPATLFTSGAASLVLERRGDTKVETVGTLGGCHMMCFGSPECPPPDGRESKTGSLDVYTSGQDPDPSKSSSP